MSVPRLRVLAGPNGSGKSTLWNDLVSKVPLGHSFNPDLVERSLSESVRFSFEDWGLSIPADDFPAFVKKHELFPKLRCELPVVEDNGFVVGPEIRGTYFTTLLAEFLRQRWIDTLQSFTFETVMSHAGKIEAMRRGRDIGYRTYLYFVCTESPEINCERVLNRVKTGGHGVPRETIIERYWRGLRLLQGAIDSANRAYLFDNSGGTHRLVAEFENGELARVVKEPPTWCVEYALPTS